MTAKLRVWIVICILSMSAFFGYALCLFPAVVLLPPIDINLYYRYVDASLSLWLRSVIFILEDIWKIRFHFYTVPTDSDDSLNVAELHHSEKLQLILCNHATNFDWMYMWVWLAQLGKLKHVRNILKSELKNVPGFGWAMQCAAFIFLERNWQVDRTTLQNMLALFRKIRNDSVLVLFPEGTSMSDRAKSKSDSFARKNNLREYNYCLHPRTTGFNEIVGELQKEDELNTIYDTTIAFSKPYPVEPSDLILKGNLPQEVHILYRVYHISGKLEDEASREQWLRSLWDEKEDTLERFYQHGSFGDDVYSIPPPRWHRRTKLLGFMVFTSVSMLCIVWLYRSPFFRMYIAFTVVCTLLIQRLYSGITEFIAKMYADMWIQ